METFGNVSKKNAPKKETPKKDASPTCSKSCIVDVNPPKPKLTVPLTSCKPDERYNQCINHILEEVKKVVRKGLSDHPQSKELLSKITKEEIIKQNPRIETECNKCRKIE